MLCVDMTWGFLVLSIDRSTLSPPPHTYAHTYTNTRTYNPTPIHSIHTHTRLNALAAVGIARFGPSAIGLLQRVKTATSATTAAAGTGKTTK